MNRVFNLLWKTNKKPIQSLYLQIQRLPIIYTGCVEVEVSLRGSFAVLEFKRPSSGDDWISFYNAPFLIEPEI